MWSRWTSHVVRYVNIFSFIYVTLFPLEMIAMYATVQSRTPLMNNGKSNWCEGFDEFVLMADSMLDEALYLESQSVSPTKIGGGSRLLPNMTFNNIVSENDYVFYQVCIARHQHEHVVHVNLSSISGDANMFLSADNPVPQRGRASWIAQHPGDDHIVLPTYLPEFPRHVAHMPLYIGVFGNGPGVSEFNLTVAIRDLPENSDVRSRQAYYDKAREELQHQKRHLRLV
jgi:hypothetical protein